MEAFTRIFSFELNASSLVLGRGETSAYQIVTPGGAWCSDVFMCGVLTEVNEGSAGVHARVVDPTGGFDMITTREPGSPGEILKHLEPPCCVSVIGKPRLSSNGGRKSITVKPTTIRQVDRIARDTWMITTTKLTLERLNAMVEVVNNKAKSAGFRDVCGHYQCSKEKIIRMARTIDEALTGIEAVHGIREKVPDNKTVLLELIRVNSGPRGIPMRDLSPLANAKGINDTELTRLIRSLLEEDECYQPSAGVIRLL